MKKKIFAFILTFAILLVGIVVYKQINPKIIELEGKYKLFNSIDELEQNSVLIVEVQINKKVDNIVKFTEEKIPYGGYTLTSAKVLKTYDGDIDEKEILVQEPYYEYKIPIGTYIHTIEGYYPITKNKKYILFLSKNEEKEYYSIVGSYQGKYYLKNDFALEDINSASIKDMELGESSNINNYKKLYKAVKDKYIKEKQSK